MKDEIKEILDEFINFDFESQGERIEINQYERNIIRDYITNLQEENEMYSQLKNEYEDIIEKAIEYIKENAWFCYKDNEEVIDRVGVDKLSNILQGVGKDD